MDKKFEAGKLIQNKGYKSFQPNFINKDYSWSDKRINKLATEAMRYLGELNAYSKLIPDVTFFIKMHVRKEALESNRIEGTHTNMNELMLPSSEISAERKDDIQEVENYVRAIDWSIKKLEVLPLSIRLIKETHAIILDGVRGYNKYPGEIRRSQNWIGGSSLNNAKYIPPVEHSLPELLSDLEKFWNNENLSIPQIIKIAISHYQFEAIHPFLDGNGRMGRLLITLQLINSGILEKPALYLSSFLEQNKADYFLSLSLVSKSNDLDQWIVFFLSMICEAAKASKETLENIIKLRETLELQLSGFSSKKQKVVKELLLKLFSKPVVTIKEIQGMLNITKMSAGTLAKELVALNILVEKTGKKKDRIFYLEEYLNLFEKVQK